MLKKVLSYFIISLASLSIFGVGFSAWIFIEDIELVTKIPIVVNQVEPYLRIDKIEDGFTLSDAGFEGLNYELSTTQNLAFDVVFKNAEARNSNIIFNGNDVLFNIRLLGLNDNAFALLENEYFSFSLSYTYNSVKTVLDNEDFTIDTDIHDIRTDLVMTFPAETVSLFTISYEITIIDFENFRANFATSFNNNPFNFRFSIGAARQGDDS